MANKLISTNFLTTTIFKMKSHKTKLIVLIKILTITISGFLLLLSLNNDAYYIKNRQDSLGSFGLIAFLLGWMNLFGAGICWLANPFLMFSWIFQMSGSKKNSFVLAILALFFSLLFLLFGNILVNEAGQHSEITNYGTGYWLWLGSCGINLIGTLTVYFWSKETGYNNLSDNN